MMASSAMVARRDLLVQVPGLGRGRDGMEEVDVDVVWQGLRLKGGAQHGH
jgi:hypothetical protein